VAQGFALQARLCLALTSCSPTAQADGLSSPPIA